MKRVHLLRYGGAPDRLGPLFEAARAEGLRVGWLSGAHSNVNSAVDSAVDSAPPGLKAPSDAGAFRAVALSEGRSVALKRVSGPPVLRDVVREHFLGCALVVVAEGAPVEAELTGEPTLEPADGGYRVTVPGEAGRVFAPSALAARLRRPRPWG